MDYGSLLNDKGKRRVLMDTFEEQKNVIQYYLDSHEAGESVPMMEKLVQVMDEFLKANMPQEPEA